MNWKYLPVVLLAGTFLTVNVPQASAHGHKHHCGAVSGSCGYCAMECACSTAPYVAPVPAPVKTQKVMVTEYTREEYDTTAKVCKQMTREVPYTVYKCEVVPVPKKVMVTHYTSVPKTVDAVVTHCEWVTMMEDRNIVRYECVPVTEDRDVTHYVSKMVPYTTTVNRCVDKGGHYECREVACSAGCGGAHHGLLHRHHSECGCESPCAAASLVSVYVPNYVMEQVPVTGYKCEVTPVTEKVKVTTYKCVEKPEVIKVAVCKLVEKKETVKVTTYECVPSTKEETVTYYESKMTPVTMTRTECYMAWVDVPVKAVKYVPHTVEKEIPVYEAACGYCGGGASYAADCGCESGHHRHGLLRR